MLTLDRLTKKYGDFTALDGLSLEIADGQLHGFVGPNGAGKTTTMRILATLLKPTSGTASVDGTDVLKNAAEARKKIGYMPDFFGVYDSLKCWEYLDFYGRCYHLPSAERKQMTDRLLDLVQLTDKREAFVDSLSRGMKQRLCLARSLIHDPSLLILDEPASGMDPRARADMKTILRTLREMGKTVLISSHILPELSEMCDSLTILDHGKLVFSGDIGNTDQPIIKDPEYITEADYVVMESTYGNRLHENSGNPLNTVTELASIIQRTLDRGGNLVIPSFAVGRTQEMLFAIREIKEKGWVQGHDGFKVYVDSPLATEATGIFLQCDRSYFDEEMLAVLNRGINPLWFDGIELSESLEDSKAINENTEPKVILSASGMCDAGRIRHHLKHNLWKAQNTVLFVGYQAEGTLGRMLQDGVRTVTLFNEKIVVNAEICTLHGTSGHADQKGLLTWLQAFEQKPGLVFINHGDDESCLFFRDMLATQYGYHAEAPFSGTQYDLLQGRMTVYTEGKRIEQKAIPGGDARAAAAYNSLVEAAQALLALVKNCRGRANKDLAKFASQIRSLVEKWQ